VRVTRNGPRASRGPVTARSNPIAARFLEGSGWGHGFGVRLGKGPRCTEGRGHGQRPRGKSGGAKQRRSRGGNETPDRWDRSGSGREEGRTAVGCSRGREERWLGLGRRRKKWVGRGPCGEREGKRGAGPRAGERKRGREVWAGWLGSFLFLFFIYTPLIQTILIEFK
jgi:hypothetical protein